MELPAQPVTLTSGQIGELNDKLSNVRHDINNYLSLINAAVELVRYKPQMLERMLTTVAQQPPQIIEALKKFSAEFEKTLGINRT